VTTFAVRRAPVRRVPDGSSFLRCRALPLLVGAKRVRRTLDQTWTTSEVLNLHRTRKGLDQGWETELVGKVSATPSSSLGLRKGASGWTGSG